jgi:penicillin amidase
LGETVSVAGLHGPVEVLRDRWGVPHIYARNTHDLFFAQGYATARDRLFQIDLWRRIGTGQLAEAVGPSAIERDRLARSVRFRGDLKAEWESYGPETREIAEAFTSGINAFIRSLGGKRPPEFTVAGYDPGLWKPEDCLARVAGLLMTRNLTREVSRALDVQRFGLARVQKDLPTDPPIRLEIPSGLDLGDVTNEVVRVYNDAIGAVRFAEQGSNNWVVDGSLTATGKPILANDPHRPVQLPSLRKTVHLVAPGWNVFGAGEPALPGVALGHNDRIAFGFTIVGIDQQDLYVEKLNPANPDQYWYRGAWKGVEVERQAIRVRGRTAPETIELRYTVHGPVIHLDRARHRAYSLRWVGTEPGAAGYLAGIAISRARNWNEFRAAIERYKVPSENIVYADVEGNIGWQAAGLAPVRPNWSGLFPVPGDGSYEWSGFRPVGSLPSLFNPSSHFIATANHNIMPAGYPTPLGYEWAAPFRYQRIREVLAASRKLTVADCERLQQDVVSIPARRFQAILRKWNPDDATVRELLAWDGAITADSRAALIFENWIPRLTTELYGADLGPRVELTTVLDRLESDPDTHVLASSLQATLADLARKWGSDRREWKWGSLHRITFRHPLGRADWSRGPISRPGDSTTVNATSGPQFQQTGGASYRQVIDLADWDRSTMTNVPGESGDPASPHYSDLLNDWAAGRYHPMPFSRRAVEAATAERILLTPSTSTAIANPAPASAR